MSTKSREQIARNLKLARKNKHFTQAQLAEKAGISTNYYARIERADVTPSTDILVDLIKALDVKSTDILSF